MCTRGHPLNLYNITTLHLQSIVKRIKVVTLAKTCVVVVVMTLAKTCVELTNTKKYRVAC